MRKEDTVHARREIISVLEKYGAIESEPKFLYEFGPDGPTDSQLSSADDDFQEQMISWENQVSENLIELFDFLTQPK